MDIGSNRVGGNGGVIVDIEDDQSHNCDSTRTSSTGSVINEELVSRAYINENHAKKNSRRKSADSENPGENESDGEDPKRGKDDTDDEKERHDRESCDEADGPNRKKSMYAETEDIPMMHDIDVTEEQALKKPSNSYAAKKTVAQGMMDIALITANANQLRYMVEFNKQSPTYYFTLILISISLVLQVVIGMALIVKGRLDIRGKSEHSLARTINNYVIIGVFLVTIINVFIASFTVTVSSSSVIEAGVTHKPTVGR